jgi:hypothetical protein
LIDHDTALWLHPQIANTILEELFDYEESDMEPGPIVLKALETLIDDDERERT